MLLIMALKSVQDTPLPLCWRLCSSYGQAALTGRRYQSGSTAEKVKPQPHISDGQDTEELHRNLYLLLHSRGGRWRLTADGKGVQRTFTFETFKRTWVSSDQGKQEA